MSQCFTLKDGKRAHAFLHSNATAIGDVNPFAIFIQQQGNRYIFGLDAGQKFAVLSVQSEQAMPAAAASIGFFQMIVAVLVTIDSLINTQNPIVFAVINQIQ